MVSDSGYTISECCLAKGGMELVKSKIKKVKRRCLMMTNEKHSGGLVSIDQHILEQQHGHPEATGELNAILASICLATKIIASQVRSAGLSDVLGDAGGGENVQGEIVQKLDLIANQALIRTLGYRHNVAIIASEEDNEPRVLQDTSGKGKYIVMFDPLDGSSNIDCNVPVGTIFTILERPSWAKKIDDAVLQPGVQQVASGYVIYGSSTVLVYTTSGGGVHMFTLDPNCGEFMLSKENLQMPSLTTQYSVNEAYLHTFPEEYKQYLDWAKDQNGGSCSMRYVGSLVSDFHRILLKGGVFLYPPTTKQPGGKLRLMYEANPLAMIAEHAGGLAIAGKDRRILEEKPTSIHCRVPLVIGGKENVEQVLSFLETGRAPSEATSESGGDAGGAEERLEPQKSS